MIADGAAHALSYGLQMANTSTTSPSAAPRTGDPARPRYLGLWVAGILLLALFGGAGGVIADVFYRLLLGT